MEIQRPRRAPALERFISEVKKEDIRVKVFGRVSEIESGLAVLEDDSGRINVDTKEPLKKGQKIILFARPFDNNGKLELQAEIIKDGSVLDENLYKKAHILLSKGGSL